VGRDQSGRSVFFVTLPFPPFPFSFFYASLVEACSPPLFFSWWDGGGRSPFLPHLLVSGGVDGAR